MYTYKQTLLLAALAGLMTACDKDDVDAPESNEGLLRVEITDAPIDDADVAGVFVTVAEVRVNGEASARFAEATTIELSNYSGGSTFVLAEDIAVDAEADARVEIVLDLESDASASGPGAYVLRADGSKDALTFGGAAQVVIEAAAAFDVEAEAETRVVADLDLRKAVKRDTASTRQDDFTFGSEAHLRASARVVDVSATGKIEGDATASYEQAEDETLIVYAFAQGSYQHDAAVDSDFANATTSARVNADGSFTLAFLPAGQYDLVTASYRNDADGHVELQGTVAVDALLMVDTKAVTVESGASASLALTLSGVM